MLRNVFIWISMGIVLSMLSWTTAVHGQGVAHKFKPHESYSLGHGEITFIHAGKESTWTAFRRSSSIGMHDEGGLYANLTYTLDGKDDKVTVLNLIIEAEKEGGHYVVEAVRFKNGQGVDALFKPSQSKTAACIVNVTKFDETGVEGSGTCTGEWKGRPANTPAIARFTFNARP